jgi:hypothetical protein
MAEDDSDLCAVVVVEAPERADKGGDVLAEQEASAC